MNKQQIELINKLIEAKIEINTLRKKPYVLSKKEGDEELRIHYCPVCGKELKQIIEKESPQEEAERKQEDIHRDEEEEYERRS